MEMDKEGRLSRERQDSFLYHGTLHVIVLDDDVLLENFDCEQLRGPLPLSQHDLPEGPLAEDHQEVEVLGTDHFFVVRDPRVWAGSLGLRTLPDFTPSTKRWITYGHALSILRLRKRNLTSLDMFECVSCEIIL